MSSDANVPQDAPVQEGESLRVAFTMSRDLDRRIEIGAALKGITKSQLVVDAVKFYLAATSLDSASVGA
jgi:hypothetical protein